MSLSFLKLKRTLPKRVLLAVLALAAIAGVVAGRERPSAELVEPSASPARASRAAEPDIDLARLRRAAGSAPKSDPFAPPRPVAAQAKAGPKAAVRREAPPLPFTYFGRLTEDGREEVFVMHGDELIALSVGQRVGREYHVEAITDSAIRFTYLPLGTRQSLSLTEVPG